MDNLKFSQFILVKINFMKNTILALALVAVRAVSSLQAQTANPFDGYSEYTNCFFLDYSKGSFRSTDDGDVFVDINFGGITHGGETNLSQIGGVTIHNIQVDTGSRGLYVTADLVSNVLTTNASSWSGTNYLSSSKRLFIGHYIKTAVNFQVTDQNSNPTIATADIPVLVVDTLASQVGGSPSYTMKNSQGKVTLTDGRKKAYSGGKLILTGGEAVSYSNNTNLGSGWNFGVGFGPDTNKTTPSGPVGDNTNQIYNAFINLTTMNQSPTNGGMVPGYILETTRIQLGLTESTTGFAYTDLQPSGYSSTNSVPDWRLSSGEVVANGVTNGPVTLLMDAGIGYAFLSTEILDGWIHHHNNSLSVNLVNSLGRVGYNFKTDSNDKNAQPNNIIAPANVTDNGSKSALFMNTGRHVFYGFDMLYDAQNGYIGVITNSFGATNPNIFFASGLYPAPGSLLRKQSITFASVAPKKYGMPPFVLNAAASSKLPVYFSVLPPSPATVSKNILTLNGAGTVTVQANQGGNTIYLPAPSVTQSFTVSKKAQAINFVQPSPKVYVAGGTFPLVATAPGGVVSFVSSNTNVISVLGSTATINGVGNSVITASQNGDTNYDAAVPVNRTATVTKAR